MATRASRPVVVTAVAALVVIVLALTTALTLRLQRDAALAADRIGPAVATVPGDMTCGNGPCGVLTSTPVGGVTVELLAGEGGKHGMLRVLGTGTEILLETALSDLGARLTQHSLLCTEGDITACLARGSTNRGLVGEVFVARGDKWEAVERPYVSTGGYLDLIRATGGDSLDVVLARRLRSGVSLEVFALDGTPQGCTRSYRDLARLPGWPDVHLDDTQLRPCD